jgi:uncharacterized membrane protein YqhA
MFRRFLSASRFLIVIPVAGSLLAATALLAYGGLEIVQLVGEAIGKGVVTSKGAKALALECIEIVDLFLLATVFYIIALGLYELFVDDRVQLPQWLIIRDLDDLKNKLAGVVVVVMAVTFLGQVVSWDGQRDLLGYGVAIAFVIAALTYFVGSKGSKEKLPPKE